MRPTASAEAFSVWTNRGAPTFIAVAGGASPGLEIAAVAARAHFQSIGPARAPYHPDRMCARREAELSRAELHDAIGDRARTRPLRPRRPVAPAPRRNPDVRLTNSTFSNWWTGSNSRVSLPGAPASFRKQGVSAAYRRGSVSPPALRPDGGSPGHLRGGDQGEALAPGRDHPSKLRQVPVARSASPVASGSGGAISVKPRPMSDRA